MPGELKPDAKCPLCEEPLLAICDETTAEGVNRVYYHGKTSARRRRSRPCKQYFTSHWKAHDERAGLEL
jgi:uncharacterized protein with PIN domain